MRVFHYDEKDMNARLPDKQPTMQRRSPICGRSRREEAREHHMGEKWDRRRREQDDGGYRESQSRFSREQSVSDMGYSPVATAHLKREAETRINQIQLVDTSAEEWSNPHVQYVPPSLTPQAADNNDGRAMEKDAFLVNKSTQPTSTQPADEATLIEERRKRREAIKARHRGRTTPLVIQGLALHTTSVASTPKMAVPEDDPAQGKLVVKTYSQPLIRHNKRPPRKVHALH